MLETNLNGTLWSRQVFGRKMVEPQYGRIINNIASLFSFVALYQVAAYAAGKAVVLKRFGKLEELVDAAIFLASEAASFVTGHLLVAGAGFLASSVNQ